MKPFLRTSTSFLLHSAVLPFYPVILLLALSYDVYITFDVTFMHDSIFWYGGFNYFVLNLAQGSLPLWDPYSFSGAPYYLNNNIFGNMDPTVFLTALFAKFGKFSVLNIYHLHFLMRFLVIYFGAYALYRYITKDKWAALWSATIVLLVLAPNSFRQHGAILFLTYIPLMVLFFLKLVSPETSVNSRKTLFIAVCYLIGLTFNFYIPSYMFVFLTLILLYLLVSRQLSFRRLGQVVADVGTKRVFAGILVFIIMAGPFIVTAINLMPSEGEYFPLARFEESPKSNTTIHDLKLNMFKSQSTVHSTFHNFMSLFIPGKDTRFNTSSSINGYMEHYLSFGLVPLILIGIFVWRARSPYKGLFIFLTIIIGIYTFGSSSLFYGFLQHYPGARSIRQLHNFLGIFLLSLGALSAICMAEAMKFIAERKSHNHSLMYGLVGLAGGHVLLLYGYLRLLEKMFVQSRVGWPYIMDIQNNIRDYGWLFIASYVLVGIFIGLRKRRPKIWVAWGMALCSVFQMIVFVVGLKPYVLQPSAPVRSAYVHYDREFEYKPVRVPYLPRFGDFKGYLPSLYRVPSAIPEYFNTYMSLGRRVFDYIRFVPAKRQRIISGIGTRRFGFFDQFVLAGNSAEALKLLSSMRIEKLKDTLVLEQNPKDLIPEAASLIQVEPESLMQREQTPSIVDRTMLKGSYQRMIDFYDLAEWVEYLPDKNPGRTGIMNIEVDKNHPAMLWPWTLEYLGFFQVMRGDPMASPNYDLLSYFPNPSLRLDFKGGGVCYNNYVEWVVKHTMPGFYKTFYDQPVEYCDLYKEEGQLFVSPELRGPFITNEASEKGVSTGFMVASLDPKTITPDQSPYTRDEDVKVIDFEPNRVRFKISNKKAGMFYYADSFDSHWTAKLDGATVPLFKAHFNFKAAFVPEGEHTLTLSYQPWGFIVSTWLFIVLSFLGIGFVVKSLRTEKDLDETS